MDLKETGRDKKPLAAYEKEVRAEGLARKVMTSIRQEITSRMPYLDRALLKMPVVFYADEGSEAEMAVGFGTDGSQIYAIPSLVLQYFEQGRNQLIRIYLHSLMHCLFTHMFSYERLEPEIWDLSADMAAEHLVLSLGWEKAEVDGDPVRRRKLEEIFAKTGGKTNADAVYIYLRDHPEALKEARRYAWLFRQDRHDLWGTPEKTEKQSRMEEQRGDRPGDDLKRKWQNTEKQMEKSAESYERARGLEPGTVVKKFNPGKFKRENFSELLRRFAVSHEEVKVDADSFDYVYYTYGLSLYENMPLIEPLEYRNDRRIRDFVIAIDTSGSTEGKLLKGFLKKTYSILKSSDDFFTEMNVHLIQCDARIQEEAVIHNQSEFDRYLSRLELKGMGGTDFRPVFERVNEEVKKGVFDDLRGLIYFTDGYGSYPGAMPPYKTAFVFLDEGREIPQVPTWASRIILEEEDLK
jgi:predicted metal-dependent peptidase